MCEIYHLQSALMMRGPLWAPLVDSECCEARVDGSVWNKCFSLWWVLCLAGRMQKSCQCGTHLTMLLRNPYIVSPAQFLEIVHIITANLAITYLKTQHTNVSVLKCFCYFLVICSLSTGLSPLTSTASWKYKIVCWPCKMEQDEPIRDLLQSHQKTKL